MERPNLLSDTDRERIIGCVREVESRTAGEVVPMIVPASYHYSAARMAGSFACALVLAVLVTAGATVMRLWGQVSIYDMWVFPGSLAFGFLIAYPLFGRYPSLRRPFITREEMEEEVREAASTAFQEHGLSRTRDRTGILIFVSLYERQVQVLADTGIDEKVDTTEWEDIVHIIEEGMKRGEPADAICRAVARCGEILADRLPPRSGDRDELRNLISGEREERENPGQESR